MPEQVRRRHRHHEAGLIERLLEVAHDAIPLSGRGVKGHQVVVVEVHAIRAQFAQLMHDIDWVQRRAHRLTEGVGPDTAHRPETKGKLVALLRHKLIGQALTPLYVYALAAN